VGADGLKLNGCQLSFFLPNVAMSHERSELAPCAGRAPALTRRDWSRIRAALWAYRCAEMNDRRGYDRVEHAEIFEASAKREREILRTLTKCKHRSLPKKER